MNETIQFDQRNYDAMYTSAMKDITKKYPYHKYVYIKMTKEDYAEYIAYSYCKKLSDLTGNPLEVTDQMPE